jgi:hypothetical protein
MSRNRFMKKPEVANRENVAGICGADGSVKCRRCMDDQDWKRLMRENIITKTRLHEEDEWLFCDYCERKL